MTKLTEITESLSAEISLQEEYIKKLNEKIKSHEVRIKQLRQEIKDAEYNTVFDLLREKNLSPDDLVEILDHLKEKSSPKKEEEIESEEI